jgi:hypothetical protein
MKMILPALRQRRSIDRLLQYFFAEYRERDFRQAVVALSRFYHLPTPTVSWFEYLDWGKTGGRTYEDGKIHLVHPENWKRGRKYNSQRRWINTVYHEIGHYVLWSNAERKADMFAYRMVRGLGASSARHIGNHDAGQILSRPSPRRKPAARSSSRRSPRLRRRRSRSR